MPELALLQPHYVARWDDRGAIDLDARTQYRFVVFELGILILPFACLSLDLCGGIDTVNGR